MQQKNTGAGFSRLVSWYYGLNPLLCFVLKFCFIFAAGSALSIAPWSEKPLRFFLAAYARVSNWLLCLCGQNSHVAGATIHGTGAALTIMRGCDALDPILVLLAGVLAYPARIRDKAIGLALAVPAIMAINVIRILSLYAVQLKAPTWFDLMHIDIWPPVFVILAGIMWIVWIRWIRKKENDGNVTA